MIITHNTGKAELCFVKVPEDAFDFEIKTCEKLYSGDSVLTYKTKFRWETFQESNWGWTTRSESKLEIVGNPFEIDKHQCKDILKDKDGYGLSVELPEPNNRAAYFNARAAMDDWLKYLKIYQTNPLGRQPEFVFDYYGKSPIEFARFEKDMFDWQQFEERTGPFILLKKIV